MYEYVDQFSVMPGRWLSQTPFNERLKHLELKCSRFSRISNGLLEQDRILSNAMRAKITRKTNLVQNGLIKPPGNESI